MTGAFVKQIGNLDRATTGARAQLIDLTKLVLRMDKQTEVRVFIDNVSNLQDIHDRRELITLLASSVREGSQKRLKVFLTITSNDDVKELLEDYEFVDQNSERNSKASSFYLDRTM